MTDLTVAICTFNGEQRLPEVLDRLHRVNPIPFTWDVLVIDNNSTDSTPAVVERYQTDWGDDRPLRYCFEPQQGLAYARQCAIRESTSDLIGFLDDDNIPELDWVAAAYTFGQEHPAAGAYSSRIYGDFEVEPPANFQRVASLLALTERGAEAHRYEPTQKVLPPAAGLVIRKQAWLENVPSRSLLIGRVHGSMLAGEDTEVLSHIQQSAWEIWYNPAMQIHHKIPHWRLERDYLVRLCRGVGLSRHVTRMLSVPPWQRPLAVWAYLLNDLRKIALHLLKYGPEVKTDPIAACELQLFLSSLASPFYIWKKEYLTPKS